MYIEVICIDFFNCHVKFIAYSEVFAAPVKMT